MRRDLRLGRRWPALLAVLLVSGCGGVQGPPAAAGRPGAGPSGRRWEPLVVDSLPIEAPMVLDPIPAGCTFANSRSTPIPAPSRFERRRCTATSLDDTLDGPVLLVGRSSGSAFIGGPPCCEGRTSISAARACWCTTTTGRG